MDSLSPFIIDAKREYLNRMTDDIAPFLFKEFQTMYATAKKTNANKALLLFQCELRDIPKWNAGIVREKTTVIESKCPWLSSLIAALFVSYIKVMSSVRVSQNERPNIRLKLPTNDVFIHKVYVETARAYYENPQCIRRTDHATYHTFVQTAIETTVRDQLPLQDILSAYLGKSVDGDRTMAPILSPANSDDEDAHPPADDSRFDRAAQATYSSSSSSSSEDGDPEPKYIDVAEHTHAHAHASSVPHVPPQMPLVPQAPLVPQVPQVPLPPPPSHMHTAPPPTPTHIPQAPKSLFDDAEDGHF